MNKLKHIWKGAFCLLIAATFIPKSYAQQSVKPTLNIGDQAPALKYAKWVQGANPISELAPDKTYVLEFWATWCAPCIAAMPHLSGLSKKYAGKIDFISCDVWETQHGGAKQETYLPKVE
ncbi:TlpA family protein disulfide reductase [Pedobacter terrae]|uniref:TlpA family protein disulfide reductase n=1 Tax=Pedobacter terrae TaxID=405671 RepID=UPI002FF4A7B5